MAGPARPHRMRTALVDEARLRCSLCSLFLRRPIYQCDAGHLACGGCRVKVPRIGCRRCRDRGVASAYALAPGLDVFFGDLQVPCPYAAHGCGSLVPFFRRADHQGACAHAPCGPCPEPGCAFAGGPPRALLAHLAAAHAWPVHELPRYGAHHALRVPAAPGPPDRLLVVREDDEDEEGEGGAAERPVFVLSVRARGAARALSVALVRAERKLAAEAAPRYRCVVWAEAPEPQGRRRVCMETDVASCAAPGKDAASEEEGMWLGVAPVMMLGPSGEMHLSVLIEKASGPAAQWAALPPAAAGETRCAGNPPERQKRRCMSCSGSRGNPRGATVTQQTQRPLPPHGIGHVSDSSIPKVGGKLQRGHGEAWRAAGVGRDG